jgi:hypothetical protein
LKASGGPTIQAMHAAAIQNARGHWLIFVNASAAHPSATVAWTCKKTNANLYDPSIAK